MKDNYYCFISDCDRHWYKIPVDKLYAFNEYLAAINNKEIEYCEENFEKYRCMHPCNYMFKNVEVLKESN